ncbi:site-specific integrase [Pseudohoeflea suaedae]|uniref:Site-specific integrase n=1 Tax=Pseudohoeflea suaedae TaxID=877384 RepID=A0A4R5PIJ2_9HYPH|nr:site-specific integrase [Pseudohoeflea suaedae]TDH35055.1 site-specific integrase [Pseudohoeflea suaedae]
MREWKLQQYRGSYCIVWNDDGGRRRYTLGTADHREAEARAPAFFAELTRPRGETVRELWQAYLSDMSGRAVTETMKFTWRAVEPVFGTLDGTAVTIAHCRAHTEARRAAGIGDGTIHTELGHLRMVLLWAEKRGLVSKAPHIERPPKPAPKDAWLTREEANSLINAAKTPHIKLAIRLMLGTAARNAAALELTWDRVDFYRSTLSLRDPKDLTRRKGRATVPLSDGLKAALVEAKAGALTNHVIEWAGAPVKSIKRGLKAAGTAIGRPDVSPHMLRHSAAVWLAEDGHSMEEIAQFLGHKNSRMTANVYARFSPTHLRKLANSLEI